MPENTTIDIDTTTFKGSISVNTELFIDGEWADPVVPETIDVINPATGKKIAAVSVGSSRDVDIAVKAAHKVISYESTDSSLDSSSPSALLSVQDHLGPEVPWEQTFATLEAINVGKSMITCAKTVAMFAYALGKPFNTAKGGYLSGSINCIRYFGGWADKVQGKIIQSNDSKLAYTRREPYGVVGQIIPWNFSMLMLSWKVGPALATGNCIVLKVSSYLFFLICIHAADSHPK
ncbi:Aldehyde dehydrogenase [Mycena venus]|uniref:Aldehyde dehydrogenase n=1 Tax=Mycena venus TaxID=2733690 RepID=A0A8H6X7V0_9AGAR|nr:Aldehyde dehydrogenase [Mycena venus]